MSTQLLDPGWSEKRGSVRRRRCRHINAQSTRSAIGSAMSKRTFGVSTRCTLLLMDVAVTELRAHLGEWIDAARDGNDVVITDRGTPVARIVALDSTPVLDRLAAEGVIGRPARSSRPIAGGRSRPKPKRPVADIVSEQRG